MRRREPSATGADRARRRPARAGREPGRQLRTMGRSDGNGADLPRSVLDAGKPILPLVPVPDLAVGVEVTAPPRATRDDERVDRRLGPGRVRLAVLFDPPADEFAEVRG